jgi:hypothetical protein
VLEDGRAVFRGEHNVVTDGGVGGHEPILHRSNPFGVDAGGWFVFRRLKPTATHGWPLRGRDDSFADSFP